MVGKKFSKENVNDKINISGYFATPLTLGWVFKIIKRS